MVKVDKADLVAAYQAVATTQEGRIVFEHLAAKFGYMLNAMYAPASTVTEGSKPEDLIFREGQRSVVVFIGKMLETNIADIEEKERSEI